jgi:hypothetical protein
LAGTRLFTPGRVAAAQIGLGLGVALLAATNRWAALFCFATPFMWLLARPSIGDHGALKSFPRSVLALMGPLVSLYVYPVAGVHVRLVDIVLIALSALIAGEGWSYYKVAGSPRIIRASRILAPVALCMMMALLAMSLVKSRAHYLSLDPLELPGAAGLRLPEEDVRAFRELAAGARNSCSYLFEIPAMPSFNLWTGLPGPTGLPFANVITGLPDSEQRVLIQSLESNPRSCIVYSPEMVTFWTHNANVSARPIMQVLQRDYHTVLESQGNRLMVRNTSPQ